MKMSNFKYFKVFNIINIILGFKLYEEIKNTYKNTNKKYKKYTVGFDLK